MQIQNKMGYRDWIAIGQDLLQARLQLTLPSAKTLP
jgi:hypothetical protein